MTGSHGLSTRVRLALSSALLFGAMLNLTLVVAGLKELVVERLGGTVADAALFFTVEMAAYLVFGPIWGLLSDRAGRRRPFVVAGFAASGALYFCFLGVDSIPLLLALRFIQGGAAIAGWSTVMAGVFDGVESSARARHAGIAGASIIFGVGTGAPIGGILTQQFGAQAPLAVAGGLFLVLALAATRLSDAPVLGRRAALGEIAALLRSRPRLLLPAGLYFAERFTIGLFVVLFPVYLATATGADPAMRGRYLALFLFPFAFGQLLTYRLTRRLGALVPLALGTAVYGGAFALIGKLPIAALPAWMALLGLAAAVIFPPTLALTAEWSTGATRASAMAGFNVAGSLGFALGPWIGAGIAAGSGYAAAFAAAGAVVLVASAVVWTALLAGRGVPATETARAAGGSPPTAL